MRLRTLSAIPLLFVAASAAADCDHTAPHRLSADLKGATSVAVLARAGSLRVTGTSAAAVTATGTACASDRDYLQGMRIEARREGSELVIEAIIPERTHIFGWHEARLDMEVNVPQHVALRVKDGSGSTEIRDVGSVTVTDGSGELEIKRVRGNVEVKDGSGSLSIRTVSGDVRIEDGSGSIEVEQIGGSVRVLEDGSGGIDIRDVERDVTIEDDGSGGIDVDQVRGNFTVENDGSGGVQYDRVGGRVRVPRER
ncbi:MAG TPA: hypothetical protein VFM36_13155 [Thermoanaerobaculia bacterium]|nr:hypothetical protein [Thermoanaerobaculia bacterium]